MPHEHAHPGASREADRTALRAGLALILAFMVIEVVAGLLASSLVLLSDAAHMLSDAAALGLSLTAARLATRPARGAMTFGLGRAEILSAQANGVLLLVLAAVILYGAIDRLSSPPAVKGVVVLVVAVAGVAVNVLAARILAGGDRKRSLNVEGSYRHIVSDLYAFIATAIAAIVIIATGFTRADAIASIAVAALMLKGAYALLVSSGRVFMEAAPSGLDPERIGLAVAQHPGVVEVHDLHIWEVTSGFPALSAHVVVGGGDDCHKLRRELEELLSERFGVQHTTLQVDHAPAPQPPLQIESRIDS